MSKNGLLYQRIAHNIEHQIQHEVLRVGDKLPSIRMICREHGVSMSTALQAYYDLESKGLIESRPQSGYYVTYSHKFFPAMPETSNPVYHADASGTDGLVAKVYAELGRETNLTFSLGVPAPELLPVAKLNKTMINAMRLLPAGGTSYEQVQGNSKLRQQIARWSFSWEGHLRESDLLTTAGCMNALAYSLMALTERGDQIVVESPVYFGVLQLARSLGLQVLELPTHAITGIDLEALKKTLQTKKIKACLLVSNFSNPLGSCMPDEHKREAVRLMETHGVPLIEDDLYGDVYFGQHRPKSCKTYDESGIVLWCGSVSKTLAPGYRVGWVAPGRFKEQVIRTKLYHSVSSTTLTQEAIASFLETGRYESHLRKLRHTLHTNSLQYLRAIGEYFPEETRVSRPEGGFLLWLELPKQIDTIKLYETALKFKISIAPGRMFTLQNQYNHCIRLSYGLLWNEQVERALKLLGNLARKMF
ncbi:PLP-dependent aminotransferase family protein [Parapedobacter indicus]|uniref:DNA-binding transcriptional regulator, MocR family, contains an aminotransferase domain n=1 Tax=Parapedobacter indicus TaxID=1477437 RepID=A0A1I3NFZ6_9SPHI|nr:PLP-dependent aminotransferase family protein [Parapedobacter indicus]PPL00974.1 DNA-binding transcriptional MocR family regulator [Parapedobacter indicus]SFJ08125.1 DNA-binding transcriptional regulator, MocR family, contains an aminotransferase domain [Parapedobacter indicus]